MNNRSLLFLLLRGAGYVFAAIFLATLYFCARDGSKRPYWEHVEHTFEFYGKSVLETKLPSSIIATFQKHPVLPHALAKAVEDHDHATIRQALDGGLDINAKDYSMGMTLLHHAATSKDVPLVQMLIARGANVNAKDDDGSTPLAFAAYKYGNIAVLNELLEHGAQVDVVDAERLTPLDYAKLAKDGAMIAALNKVATPATAR